MVCGGNLFGIAFWVVNGSLFQELGRVSEEGETGSEDGFQAGTLVLVIQVAFGHAQNDSGR